jgi:hypothetical protein
MRAVTAAALTQLAGVRGEWGGADNYGISFGANVHQPHEFGRIGASILNRFIRDERQAALEYWLNGVSPSGVRR